MPYLIAIAFATITCLIGYSLPFYKAQDFYGILLVMIAGGYVGFGVSDGRRHVLVLELVVTLGFCALVLLGMWKWPILIAYGYFLHAVWDLLHQPFKVGARVRAWYPMSAIIYSGMVGAFIYFHLFR
jgi:hypothetical protein